MADDFVFGTPDSMVGVAPTEIEPGQGPYGFIEPPSAFALPLRPPTEEAPVNPNSAYPIPVSPGDHGPIPIPTEPVNPWERGFLGRPPIFQDVAIRSLQAVSLGAVIDAIGRGGQVPNNPLPPTTYRPPAATTGVFVRAQDMFSWGGPEFLHRNTPHDTPVFDETMNMFLDGAPTALPVED